MKTLSAQVVREALKTLPGWRRRGSFLHGEFNFDNFVEAMKFVNRVAKAAEKVNHHPNIDIRWNQVHLSLTTHDAGGLTDRDFALARKCSGLVG